MRQTTRGIVLNHIKYQETSIIAHIFTEVFGKQSYLVKGVRTARSKYPMALFQPLMPLDLLVAPAKHGTLHHLVEVGCYQPISNILADLRKATMATFLAELFYKAVSEADQGGIFFAFLLQVVRELDALTQHHALFYLRCMLSLAQHLGFGCTTASQLNKELMHSGYPTLSSVEEHLLDQLIQQKDAMPVIDRHLLRSLTQGLVHFLQLHVPTLHRIHSLKILQSLNE